MKHRGDNLLGLTVPSKLSVGLEDTLILSGSLKTVEFGLTNRVSSIFFFAVKCEKSVIVINTNLIGQCEASLTRLLQQRNWDATDISLFFGIAAYRWFSWGVASLPEGKTRDLCLAHLCANTG